MTTQTPMTVDEAFDGADFRTNWGREGTRFFFNGHLTAQQIVDTYRRTYPEPRDNGGYILDAHAARHAWHVFTAHSDDCYLIAEDDPNDPFTDDQYFLCTCEAHNNYVTDGRGYEYRHPHPATASTPGAIPVTWVDVDFGAR